jgi:SPW repeat
MKRVKHWQDPVNAVLGVWLFISPFVMHFSGDRTATINALIVGVALVAAALGAIMIPRAWEEWTEAVLGLWLIVSPWVLGFSKLVDARSVVAITGAVVLVMALWTLATDKGYSPWLRQRKAQ